VKQPIKPVAADAAMLALAMPEDRFVDFIAESIGRLAEVSGNGLVLTSLTDTDSARVLAEELANEETVHYATELFILSAAGPRYAFDSAVATGIITRNTRLAIPLITDAIDRYWPTLDQPPLTGYGKTELATELFTEHDAIASAVYDYVQHERTHKGHAPAQWGPLDSAVQKVLAERT
jgi:hypothetical protein